MHLVFRASPGRRTGDAETQTVRSSAMRPLLSLIVMSLIAACGAPVHQNDKPTQTTQTRFDVMEKARELSLGGQHHREPPIYGTPGDTPHTTPGPAPCNERGLGDQRCP
ncbi:hypothetical protein SSE37_05547 [Sagittula stellata E-37]|uniref:Uncharacterized protein n=2 Tax=Sagittula stellata TaxID=52603 RepID=A3K9F0_SAGS3|nr:hypothetical protein SSE37_05547 [Sagittula stellata E-37]